MNPGAQARLVAWLGAVTLAALPAAGGARAQVVPRESAGAIVLPRKLVAGKRATLALLDAEGRLKPRAVVEFTGGGRVTTDETGRATFTAPAEPGVLLAHLSGGALEASTAVVAPPENAPDGVQVLEYPHVVSFHDRFAIDGWGFRGDAETDHVLLGDQPALVLAASPVSLVVLPGPKSVVGPTQLVIEVGGRSPGPVPLTLVSLEMVPPGKALAAGEKANLTVRVQGSAQRLVLEARNLTPDIVDLPRGNFARVTTRGGAENTATIEMVGLRTGDFSISVHLVPGAAGMPDTEAARQQLLAARKLAPRKWRARVNRALRRLERNPQDYAKVRDDLEKMLAEKPSGEFAARLQAAWEILLQH